MTDAVNIPTTQVSRLDQTDQCTAGQQFLITRRCGAGDDQTPTGYVSHVGTYGELLNNVMLDVGHVGGTRQANCPPLTVNVTTDFPNRVFSMSSTYEDENGTISNVSAYNMTSAMADIMEDVELTAVGAARRSDCASQEFVTRILTDHVRKSDVVSQIGTSPSKVASQSLVSGISSCFGSFLMKESVVDDFGQSTDMAASQRMVTGLSSTAMSSLMRFMNDPTVGDVAMVYTYSRLSGLTMRYHKIIVDELVCEDDDDVLLTYIGSDDQVVTVYMTNLEVHKLSSQYRTVWSGNNDFLWNNNHLVRNPYTGKVFYKDYRQAIQRSYVKVYQPPNDYTV